MGTVTMHAFTALLAYLYLVTAELLEQPTSPIPAFSTPNHVLNEKVYVYKYSTEVLIGQNEPSTYVSKLQIEGKLLQKSDISDTNFKFSKYMKFHEIKHSIYNGVNNDEARDKFQLLDNTVRDFEQPFVIVSDRFNKLIGVKVQDQESVWSKNMKKSLASILQIEFNRFELHENTTSTAFQITEKTIHGNCSVNYNVYTDEGRGKKWYYVRKVFEPRSCSKYIQYVVSDENGMNEEIELNENLITIAERIYEFEFVNNDFLMRKVIAHENISYIPSLHKNSKLQFINTKQVFAFENIMDVSTLNLTVMDFKNVQLDSDITFDNLEYESNMNTVEENFNRRKRKLSDTIAEVQELLVRIMDNLNENHITIKDMYKNEGELLEKLKRTISYLNSESLYNIYKSFNVQFEKEYLTRNILLEVIPYTGTYAAWNFTKFIIINHEVSDEIAVNMLTNLALYVFNTKEQFVKEMIGLMQFDKNVVSDSVVEAGILCYSILLHKAYRNVKNEVPFFLKQQLDYFDERIKLEPSYRMKVLYMMAMRNVEVGNIFQYLSPIVSGNDIFILNEDIVKPEKYRIVAMWAVAKSICRDRELTYNLFWPIFSDDTQTLAMRIMAYEFLVPRNPLLDTNLLMNVHLMMQAETNPHIFNYHYTTLKSIAKSTHPHMKNTSNMMRKMLRLVEERKIPSSKLSNANIFDYYNANYDQGKILKSGIIFNEASGIPQVGYYETTSTFGRRAVLTSGVYWNIDGVNLNTIKTLFEYFIKEPTSNEIINTEVKNLLRQTHGYKLLEKEIQVELWVTEKGYVTLSFDMSLSDFLNKYVKNYIPTKDVYEEANLNYNLLDVYFFNHYKMIVATDAGMPAILHDSVSQILYMKFNPNVNLSKTIVTTNIRFEFKFHRHNCYEIKLYNPLADVTHSVKKKIVLDVSLPFDVTISVNMDTYSLKIIFSRTPEIRFSVGGIKIYSIDQVEIGNDYTNILKTCCLECKNVTNITKNSIQNVIYDYIENSMNTGLEYRYTTFDCEDIAFPDIENENSLGSFAAIENNVNDGTRQLYKMINQGLYKFMTAFYTNSCGLILKISPSTIYPTSYIEMSWLFNIKKLDNNLQLDVHGSIDTKTAFTNETMRYWNIYINTYFTQFVKYLQVQLTRKTRGEKTLKICLDFQKVYPNYIVNARQMKHETNTKITYAMGYSNNSACVYDDAFINVTMKGELLDEQFEQMEVNSKSGSCFRNPLNSLDLDITKRFDWNCLYQAIQATTMKKYLINVSYKQIPYDISTMISSISLLLDNSMQIVYTPTRTEHGNIKIHVTYAMDSSYGNISVINPFLSYELVKVPFVKDQLLDIVLDNTGFSTVFLSDYYNGEIRPCIAHANDIITDLNQTIKMKFDDWTLMIGDYELMTYAIFVKSIDNDKVAVKMYVSASILEIQPGESKPIVILDDTIIQNYERGMKLPTSMESYLKLMMFNQLLMVEINGSSNVRIYYTPYNIVTLPQIDSTSNIDGICGHMGSSSYVQQVPLVCNKC